MATVGVMDPDRRADAALARLTPAQHEAVTAEDHRLAVLAGAGAGKTTVLITVSGAVQMR